MVQLIAQREFKVLASSKAHRITLILITVLILAAGLAARIIMNSDFFSGDATRSPPAGSVGVETQMEEFIHAIAGVETVENIASAESESWIKDQLSAHANAEDSEKDIVFAALGGTPEAPVIYTSASNVFSAQNSAAQAILQRALLESTVESFGDSPLTAAQKEQLNAAQMPSMVPVSTDEENTDPLAYITSIFSLMLLFMAVLIGMNTISQGVVEEKASRVVEILLSTVKPRKLLLGKILGIGAFVIMELAIWLAAAVAALHIADIWQNVHLGSVFGWSFAWVITGFFIFSTLVGGVASMVSRQEDLAAVQSPLIFGILIPFYLAIYLVPFQPDSLLTRILSMIPGFSSFMIPMRQSLSSVPLWESLLALVLAVAAIPLCAALAGRIYQNSILRMGNRVSYKEALKGSSK